MPDQFEKINGWGGEVFSLSQEGAEFDRTTLYDQLIGPGQQWLAACRRAVTEERMDWLEQFLPERVRMPPPLDDIADIEPEHVATMQAMVAAADLALLLREGSIANAALRVTRLYQAATLWQVHLCPGHVVSLAPDDALQRTFEGQMYRVGPSQLIEDELAHLKQHHPDWHLAPIRDLLDDFRNGQSDSWVRSAIIPVVFDQYAYGTVATLRLEARNGGLGEWYADHRTMGFLRYDARFRQALEDAWAYAEQWNDGRTDVRWSLHMRPTARADARHFSSLDPVEGSSLGLGLAVGLCQLLAPDPVTLDPTWAFTGSINRNGEICSVAGYETKMFAVHSAGLSVIIPASDKALADLSAPPELVMRTAENVPAALEAVSAHMHDLLVYFDRLIEQLGRPPPYLMKTDFDFDRVRQRLRVSHQRLRADPRDDRQREIDRWNGFYNADEGTTRQVILERAYRPTRSAEAWLEDLEGIEDETLVTQIVDWDTVRIKVRRAVILGDPGFGKSWLLRAEARRVAYEQRAALATGTLGPDSILLPIHLRLSTLALSLGTSADLAGDIANAVRQSFRQHLSSPFFAWLAWRLKRGLPCIFLLDALDEVPTEPRALRAQLHYALEELAAQPQFAILLTSRGAAYDTDRPPFPLHHGEQECELELVAFDRMQVQEFIAAWFGKGTREEDRLQVLLDAEPAIMAMARIPLLLSFLCKLAGEGSELPRRRVDLYEAVLYRLLKGIWRVNEMVEDDAGRIETKISLLEEIAWHFATAKRSWRDLMERAELNGIIERDIPRDVRLRSTSSHRQSMLWELSEHDGMLIVAGDNDQSPFIFLHRTFHEYLVARHLARMPRGECIAHVGSHLWYDADWAVALVLLAGCLDESTQLLHAMLAEENDVFHTMLLFAGRCLAEARPGAIDEKYAAMIIERLLQLLRSASEYDRTAAAKILGLTRRQHAVEGLLIALRDENADISRVALSALGELGDARAVPALIALLHSRDADIRKWAAEALGQTGIVAAPALIQELLDENWLVRFWAAQALGRIGDARAVSGLLDALRDGRSGVARNAAEALGRIGDARAVSGLLDALRDGRSGVRLWAAWALGEIGDERAIINLIVALDDLYLDVGRQAGRSLGKIGAPAVPALLIMLRGDIQSMSAVSIMKTRAVMGFAWSTIGADAVPNLLDTLRDQNPEVRKEAVSALGGSKDARAVLNLLDALHDESVAVRHAAVWALGRIGDARAVPGLLDALRCDDQRMRLFAARSLGSIGDARAVPGLLDALNDHDPNVRQRAAISLGILGQKQVLTALLDALQSDSADTRSDAVSALRRIEDEHAVPGLLALLCNDHSREGRHAADTRRHAAEALGRIGDARAVPGLLDALRDEQSNVRLWAAWGLREIGDERAIPALLTVRREKVRSVNRQATEALARIVWTSNIVGVAQSCMRTYRDPATSDEDRLILYEMLARCAPQIFAADRDHWSEWRSDLMPLTEYTFATGLTRYEEWKVNAARLLNRVLVKFPDFTPAQRALLD